MRTWIFGASLSMVGGLLATSCGSAEDSMGGTMTGAPTSGSETLTGAGGKGGSAGATGQGGGGSSNGIGGGGVSTDGGGQGGGLNDAALGTEGSVDGGPRDGGDAPTVCPDPPKPPCAATDLAGKLRCIPGLTIKPSSEPPRGYQRFDLDIEQPVDHHDPNGPKFKQRLILLHRSATAPLVLSTSGYSLSAGATELTTTFATNQISIEHRFFTPSVPAGSIPWDDLTIAQSAADFHHVWEAFKWLYPAKWANTGASKGGETSVFHRRFYPCDVDATVAYVAPLVFGLDDQRFVSFVANVGGAAYASCRTKLVDLSKALLNRRAELVPKMDASKFTKLGRDVSFEHAVLDLIFAFWQYQPASRCNTLPAPTASADTLFAFMNDIGLLDGADDSSYDYFLPYYYQAGLELGLPGTYDQPFTSLLRFPGTYTLEAYLPMGLRPVFRPEAMPDIQSWVSRNGQRLMFIYGELDPWTAGAYDLGNASDSFKFVAPLNNHGSSISELRAADQEKALSTLERWLGVTRLTAPPPPVRFEARRRFFRF